MLMVLSTGAVISPKEIEIENVFEPLGITTIDGAPTGPFGIQDIFGEYGHHQKSLTACLDAIFSRAEREPLVQV